MPSEVVHFVPGGDYLFTLNTCISWSLEKSNRIKRCNYSKETFSKTQRNLILTLIAWFRFFSFNSF